MQHNKRQTCGEDRVNPAAAQHRPGGGATESSHDISLNEQQSVEESVEQGSVGDELVVQKSVEESFGEE